MSQRNSTFAPILFGLALLLCAAFAHSQVPVAMAPPIHFQFLNASGQPLANGKIYTYTAGTTTCTNTYIDSTGTIQNPCPLLLDVTGSPTNGSAQVGIWLGNASYKFVAYDQFNVFQWSVDNVSTYFGLLNTANTWSLAQTFQGQIIDTLTDNQIVLGVAGNQTTLDAPPPSGNIALHFPSTTDTLVGRATTDTLTNKTLTAPNFNGVCSATGGPGTYICIANANPTGTATSTLTIVINAPSQAAIAPASTTAAILGICVSACGNSGTAVIQQSGTANCIFDGATTAGDSVQVSNSTAGNCHDAGSAGASGVIVGTVLTTNASAGTFSVLLSSGSGGANSPLLTISNSASTGTTLHALAKVTGAPSTAVITATTDVGGALGIVVAGAGTSGSAVIQQSGFASCLFDASTTAGDYVQLSSSTAGDCHDAGSAYPANAQILGRIFTSNTGSGTYQMLLGPETRGSQQVGSASFSAGTGAGTGGTVACNVVSNGCSDAAGSVTLTTGTSPASGGPSDAVFTITFSRSYVTSSCIIGIQGGTVLGFPVFSAYQQLYTAGIGGNSVTFTSPTTLTGSGATYGFIYNCLFRTAPIGF